ncbi:hypothetical protein [Aquisphaera insulae]|uniref:hypothetical protein n=1 Tax=Aquisphaera insulae TaxID=2712864 RepID=UPI0013EA5443|nr:hypothetical protein [Aquisphaera insulae]
MATEEEKKHAYKAFKKRLKLMRLDDQSGLSPGSKTSKIGGITPPPGHPPGIWDELARDGKLKKEGHGIYSMANEIQPRS